MAFGKIKVDQIQTTTQTIDTDDLVQITDTVLTDKLDPADIGVTVQGYDVTTLKSADIGVTVQAFDATTLKSADIGVTVQAFDATTLKSADIGVTVQGYDADTAKTDVAQTFTAAQRGTVTALTDGATITPDFAVANNFSVTLGGNRTLANPTNVTAGQSGVIVITQDGTGSRTLAYGSNWKFAGGTDPTLTTAANAVDVLTYYAASSTIIIASALGDVK
jgi:hypothetical protein